MRDAEGLRLTVIGVVIDIAGEGVGDGEVAAAGILETHRVGIGGGGSAVGVGEGVARGIGDGHRRRLDGKTVEAGGGLGRELVALGVAADDVEGTRAAVEVVGINVAADAVGDRVAGVRTAAGVGDADRVGVGGDGGAVAGGDGVAAAVHEAQGRGLSDEGVEAAAVHRRGRFDDVAGRVRVGDGDGPVAIVGIGVDVAGLLVGNGDVAGGVLGDRHRVGVGGESISAAVGDDIRESVAVAAGGRGVLGNRQNGLVVDRRGGAGAVGGDGDRRGVGRGEGIEPRVGSSQGLGGADGAPETVGMGHRGEIVTLGVLDRVAVTVELGRIGVDIAVGGVGHRHVVLVGAVDRNGVVVGDRLARAGLEDLLARPVHQGGGGRLRGYRTEAGGVVAAGPDLGALLVGGGDSDGTDAVVAEIIGTAGGGVGDGEGVGGGGHHIDRVGVLKRRDRVARTVGEAGDGGGDFVGRGVGLG